MNKSLVIETVLASLKRSLQEARKGKVLYGNPREFIKKNDAFAALTKAGAI